MVKANYHTHTKRCKHARGSERAYVENAIKQRFDILGFSDHTPQPYENGFISPIRMDMAEFDDYVDTVRALKEEFSDRIEIKTGLEAEYFPVHFDRLMNEVRKREIDYLILGQHYVPDEENGFYAGSLTYSEANLSEYVDVVIEALETGEFMYLAHPDLIHFEGPENVYLYHMQRLCDYAHENGVLLELNALGFLTDRWYPSESFFKLAAKTGCRFIYGCDAHSPDQVIQPEHVSGLTDFMAETGISFS